MNVGFPIDFVVTWVDGNDAMWRQKKAKYEIGENESRKNDEIATNRYREFGLFKYWFRSIQKNAPWVRKIYIVTDNQTPEFLDLNNPKVEIVDHKDIINQKYLPTFDSNTIDWNLFKIDGLSEHFVYFNDDMFINKPVVPEDFFSSEGKARDTVGQSVIMPIEGYDHTLVNNTMKINQLVKKRDVLIKERAQFFSLKQGIPIFLLNVFLSVFPRFTRLYDAHTAYSFIKKDMTKAYSVLKPELHENFMEKFRTADDYSIQFVRYYQIILGHVKTQNMYFGQTANTNQPEKIKQLLFNNRRAKVTNVNDKNDATDEDLAQVVKLFERRFPDKSEFEVVR
ncbi:stealth family protein [Lactiplantibacillus paraplantarum]|uniref:stealth family protein n=1 Tax=Lactiplantibacillus paraplantarum TaxID=60520 RepID=UPI003B28C3C3